MVHYWSLTSEFSIENLEKFADEVQTVLGLLVNDATDEGLKYFARKHPEIIEFQLGSDDTDTDTDTDTVSVTDTDTSKCSLNGLQTVMSLPNLTSVKINRKIQPIPDQSIFSMLFILSSRLTTLGLYNLQNIPEESILVLLHSCSSSLKTIHLSGNSNITDVILLKIFQKFGSSLESLDLSNSNVTGEKLSEFNGSLPVITELGLFNCKLTDTGLLYLLHLGRKTLDSMVIAYTPITGEKLKEFEGTMECLETFDFHSCEQITDGGLLQIIRICGSTLTELNLSFTPLTGEGLVNCTSSLENVEKLDCSFAFELTDHGLFQLLSLCGDNLETLNIDDTCVTCNMLSIENLPHIQNLKSLNCSSTSLVDSGLLQLLRLWGNTLTHLDIGDNDITGEGLSELGVCSLPCIEEISLWCENLSDDGLVKFLKLCKKNC
ncbi:F-box protein At3g58530 isoform X2 [Eurytemora carolleeae]|nr:F-box protein At3g58530 isoform X2 [Eurytemora carolleeae]|eukprot:XP_023348064.1 F-box protein At3g58530-like isoform X2 [Eurytemora affinis]